MYFFSNLFLMLCRLSDGKSCGGDRSRARGRERDRQGGSAQRVTGAGRGAGKGIAKVGQLIEYRTDRAAQGVEFD